ncbi:hypothetical protein PAPYR_13329 [Paratrimastix pyriformis]|uniref:Uncharacterized protein n=1 Tax=Paratrimastix pyriformis TaxID=342808 RepID=A0ABQ8U2S8_9EUKA|nr:hypothetical protein PAPYR_13329 [Paratrimastix pyriformis]
MKFRTFYIDVQHLPHRLVPLSLLAASPALPDLSPLLAWVAPRHGRRPAVTTLHLPQRLSRQAGWGLAPVAGPHRAGTRLTTQGRWRCPVQHDPLRPTGRPGADKGPCEVATTGLGWPRRLPRPGLGQPAPADPQQERLKNRVIAAFQMQQLVEELAQREQAASDAAARCRDLEGRLSVMAADLEERSGVRGPSDPLFVMAPCRFLTPAGRGSAACEGLIGTLQAATAALAKVAHSDAALTIKRPVSTSAVHFDAEPHLQCWSGKAIHPPSHLSTASPSIHLHSHQPPHGGTIFG